MEFEIWAEKYRPKKLDEIINQKHVVERLKAFVNEGSIPHLLFAGPAGTGKTTSALALANELYGEQWHQNVLEMNASDERKIEDIRTKVKEFARIKPIGNVPFKIILMDEADALTADAQQALRRMMEDYAFVTRFILTCNYSSKIIDPIQSRCAVFRFKPLEEKDVREFIERIVKNEKLKIEEKAIDAVVYLAEGDLRRVANLLQAAAIVGKKITADIIYEVASRAKPEEVKEMLELTLKGNFEKARTMLQSMLLKQGLSGADIISEIHKQIYGLSLPEEAKVQLIEKCGEYEFRISEGANELIQLEALLASLLLYAKKK